MMSPDGRPLSLADIAAGAPWTPLPLPPSSSPHEQQHHQPQQQQQLVSEPVNLIGEWRVPFDEFARLLGKQLSKQVATGSFVKAKPLPSLLESLPNEMAPIAVSSTVTATPVPLSIEHVVGETPLSNQTPSRPSSSASNRSVKSSIKRAAATSRPTAPSTPNIPPSSSSSLPQVASGRMTTPMNESSNGGTSSSASTSMTTTLNAMELAMQITNDMTNDEPEWL
jgi:hypothetical protein